MLLPILLNDPGLIAWRKPDARGQACVSCHSPDGIELSAFGFSRDDILRRSARHVVTSDADAIVAMLNRRPASATPESRPLQPGGKVLPGDTAAERDLAFLAELAKVAPIFATGSVNSEQKALLVRDELLRVDLTRLPVGIPFNRLSEDGFHGTEHRSLAHWIPDVPVLPVSAELSNRYLANPTDENLDALDRPLREALSSTKTPGELLALEKYRALMVLQHRLRTGRFYRPDLPTHSNPLWEVADFARRYEGEADISLLGYPSGVAEEKQRGPSFTSQLRELRLPWFWMGWTVDPALQKSGIDGETRRGDYFVRSLWRDGPYPGHLAFMISKKLIEQGFNPRLWNNPRFSQRYEISLSGFVMGPELQALSLKGEYRRRFEKIAANTLRTALYLSRKSVRETGEAFHPQAQTNQANLALTYLKKLGALPTDASIVRDLVHRLQGARALR